MRTLVVLCAGGRKVNGIPLYLNNHPDGRIIAEKVLEGIFANSYDRIVYSILKEDDEKFNAKKIITDNLSKVYDIDIDVICLDKKTSGPAETVYITIEKAGIEGEISIRDSLNAIKLQKPINGNYLVGLDLTEYNEDVYKVRTKSFIVCNEQNQVLDVVEKRFRSDLISVGLYGFKKTEDFIMAFDKLSDENYPIKSLYISNIISYLIGYKQRVFHCVETTEHEDWGSLETWHLLQKKYALCFLDIDEIIEENCTNIKQILVNELNETKNTKKTFVLFSSREIVCKEDICLELLTRNIKCLGIIDKCPYTIEKQIISSITEMKKFLMEV